MSVSFIVLLNFQLKIVRVDPFKNGSCYSEDKLEGSSIYKKYKGSTYSVQVSFFLVWICLPSLWFLLKFCEFTIESRGRGDFCRSSGIRKKIEKTGHTRTRPTNSPSFSTLPSLWRGEGTRMV